jgi:hypothetical protein
MGAPMPDMEPVENASAEALLDSLKTIDPAERRKHASVFNYWLSIRANRQFPPIRDLDPLEISDAGPWSIMLEMIGGGEDAVVRHFGQANWDGLEIEKIGEAPNPSLLSCIHAKLPIVAACREAYAFEDSFETDEGPRRCWVTLLPFSSSGTWIDFVYGYVSLDGTEEAVAEEPEIDRDEPETAEIADELAEPDSAPAKVPFAPFDEAPVDDVPEVAVEYQPDPVVEVEPDIEPAPEPVAETAPAPESIPGSRPSLTAKLRDGLASVGDFYGKYGKVTQSGPELPAQAFVEESIETAPADEFAVPASTVEGLLQSKLSDVRAMAEEAREAQIRSNMALYQGLSAAYDFALDAEDAPEEYLRLVEAEGLKIQLRSPMQPVVKLAFDGMCDEPTIKQLEAVLAWALKHDLPRGTLTDRIEAEGGIGAILKGQAD